MEDGTGKEIGSVPKRHWTVIFIVCVVMLLIALSNIPLLYGYLNQPPGLKFMGIFAGVRDSNIYFMMMVQGDGSSPIIENLFLPGEPNAIYHGFFWFALGKLSRWLRVSNLAMFHVARAAAVIIFVVALYSLLKRFLDSQGERLSGLILICFGAGAGWLMMIFYHRGILLPFFPHDIEGPEATAFYTHMTFPHVAFSLVFIVLCMLFVWDAIDSGRLRPALLAGLCGLLLGFMHVFNLVVICLALALFGALSSFAKRDKAHIGPLVIFGGLSVLPIAYYVFVMLAAPGALPPGAVRSPTPFAYLVGFAPLLLASVIRAVFLWRSRSLPRSDLFLFCWIAASAVLLYSYPLISQEQRAVLGLQVPLAIMSVRALFQDILPAVGLPWNAPIIDWRRALARAIVVLFVIFGFPSSFYNIYQRIERLKSYPEAFSLTHDEYDALKHLREVPEKGIVLSSSERVGSYIPRVAYKRAWMGEYDYPSYARRVAFIEKFFTESLANAQYFDMLTENDIEFIFYGEHERSLGQFRPDEADYLKMIHRNSSVEVYRMQLKGSPSRG